jgi:hypothetical protein
MPRIIEFGVAKPILQTLTTAFVYTQIGTHLEPLAT